MGLKNIFALILVILMISISLEVGVSSSIGLQDGADLQDEESNDLADSAWPKYQGNKRNTGRSPYDTSHVDGGLEWAFSKGGEVRAEPVVGPDGTIYVCFGRMGPRMDEAALTAINPDGTEEWSFQEGRWIRSSPALASDGSIYLGINDYRLKSEWNGRSYEHIGAFYGINPNGTEKWNYSVDSAIYSSPTIGEDGTIYGGLGEKLYAFEQDGTVKWNLTAKGNVYSSPAIGNDGTIYFGVNTGYPDYDGFLYAVNPDGTEKWNYFIEGAVRSPVLGDDGTIYVGSHDGHLYAMDQDGNKKWSFETEHRILSSPVISENGDIYVSSNHLHAIDQDGSEKWRFNISDDTFRSHQPIIGGDGTIYIGSFGRTVYAIEPDGEKIWDFEPPYSDGKFSATIDQNGTLYVTYSGLHALGERERPDFTDVFTAFLANNWCFITLFAIIGMPVIYKLIKSWRQPSSPPRENIFEEDDTE